MEESENRGLQEQELEGLKMTLTDQELKVLSECEIEYTLIPQRAGDKLIELKVSLSKPGAVSLTSERVPLMRVRIGIGQGYPSEEPPSLNVQGFYGKYQEQLREILDERWSPGMLVLYDWYSYLQSDFLDEVVLPIKEPLTSI
jgi:hypothetical protein